MLFRLRPDSGPKSAVPHAISQCDYGERPQTGPAAADDSEGSKIRTEGSKFLEGSKFRKLDISQPDTLHTTRNRTLRIFDGAKSDTLNTPSKSDTLNTAPDTLRECLAPDLAVADPLAEWAPQAKFFRIHTTPS